MRPGFHALADGTVRKYVIDSDIDESKYDVKVNAKVVRYSSVYRLHRSEGEGFGDISLHRSEGDISGASVYLTNPTPYPPGVGMPPEFL